MKYVYYVNSIIWNSFDTYLYNLDLIIWISGELLAGVFSVLAIVRVSKKTI